jgi:hypothetical protein
MFTCPIAAKKRSRLFANSSAKFIYYSHIAGFTTR